MQDLVCTYFTSCLAADRSRVNYPVVQNWLWVQNSRPINYKVYALKHWKSGFFICSLGKFKSFKKCKPKAIKRFYLNFVCNSLNKKIEFIVKCTVEIFLNEANKFFLQCGVVFFLFSVTLGAQILMVWLGFLLFLFFFL